MVAAARKRSRQVVVKDAVGIADGFALAAVEVFQAANQEIAHRMPAEIGGDEAQAEAALGVANVPMWPPGGAKRCGVSAVVLGVGRGEVGEGHVGAVLHREQKAVVGRGVGLEFQRPAVAGRGLVQSALRLADRRQVEVRSGDVRREFEGAAQRRHGFVESSLFLQGKAEVVVGRGVTRREIEGAAVAGHGLIELPLPLQGESQVVVNPGVVRPQSQGSPIAGDGFVQLRLGLAGVAEI